MNDYEIPLYEDEKLLKEFLDRWPLSEVKKITIEEYTDVNNRFTFTQWVENQTRPLGSINGISSLKFGIYKRRDPKKKSKSKAYSNDIYSWIKSYGESDFDANVVFEQVRDRVVKVIEYAQQLDFESIEKVDGIYNLFKWKVAFLYSGQSMIPVFNRDVLLRFTRELKMEHTKKVEYAKMHRYLYDKKPPNLSVFNFMRKLFHEAGLLDEKDKPKPIKPRKRNRSRKATNKLNTEDQFRKGTEETITVQHHKKFQERLYEYLDSKYPNANISFEKNFIDLLLVSNSEVHYYEVKTALTSETCIKQGLGQLLSYSFYEEQVEKKHKGLKKKIVIVGQLKAKEYDLEFINYVNESLNVNFEYLSLEEIT
ncbi:hypothetical protein [uncultured Psychroserpens sp.]|uniref:hypothetical protein n=1 Tax=uncultured Psychroserpens sp. TaxID=255436 RepID=UPI002620C8EC|nr:hypothetical protein [uncultured Psychroserpens sp.]